MTNTIVATVLMLLVIGCTLPMHKMQASFNESVQATVGHALDQLKDKHSYNFVGEMEPSEIHQLEEKTILYVYRDYWRKQGIERESCDVFLEFDEYTMKVVRAYSTGKGCYRAY